MRPIGEGQNGARDHETHPRYEDQQRQGRIETRALEDSPHRKHHDESEDEKSECIHVMPPDQYGSFDYSIFAAARRSATAFCTTWPCSNCVSCGLASSKVGTFVARSSSTRMTW